MAFQSMFTTADTHDSKSTMTSHIINPINTVCDKASKWLNIHGTPSQSYRVSLNIWGF